MTIVFARFSLRRLESGRLALLMPLRVRILPALVSGWLLYVLVGAGGATGLRAVALSIFALCLLAALYDDRWVFDGNKKKVTRRFGLPFAARETSLDMASLRRVIVGGRIVSGGRSGSDAERPRCGAGSFASLCLEDAAGNRHRLERYVGSRAGELRAVAAEIAAFCALPLEDQTAPAA